MQPPSPRLEIESAVNRDEARLLLDDFVAKARQLPFTELRRRIEDDDIETCTVTAPSGVEYQIEFIAVWDDPNG